MLYQTNSIFVESEKERNLYAKFFAGYYFNELVDGANERLVAFSKLLTEKAITQGVSLPSPLRLNPKSTHVTFDAHGYLFQGSPDRGELADVLVSDTLARLFVAIEVKYLTNLSAEKDLKPWMRRISSLEDIAPMPKIVPVALVPEEKWKRAEAMRNHPESNAKKFDRCYRNRIVLVFWEELLRTCQNSDVILYVKDRIRLASLPKAETRIPWSNSRSIGASDATQP